MAPVIWGLDLKEMQWGKFKSSYMFKNTDYHLRRTKFIVYQCALIFCVVSESLGTAALSDYVDSQRFVKSLNRKVYVFNNDFVGVASYNIFAGVFVAFIFGGAFFFDLFWPARHESKAVRIAWKVCGVLSCVFYTAAAFALTIVTATHCGYYRGADRAYGDSLLHQFHKDGGTQLCYRHNSRAVASVVFSWPAMLSVIGSCVLLFMSIDHTEKGPGPLSTHARQRDAESSSGMEKASEKDTDIALPELTHVAHPREASNATPEAASNSTEQPVHAG